MRACGISEEFITGDKPGWEKFKAFAEVLPRAIGNPIYHWAHLELQRFFDCYEALNPDTASRIWEICKTKLSDDENMRVRGIVNKARVELLVTSDDPADDLLYHKKIAEDSSCKTKVLPCWRPGLVLDITNPDYMKYIERLAKAAETSINTHDDLRQALITRMNYFNSCGCVVSDHGVETFVFAPATDKELNNIFSKAQNGEPLNETEINQYVYDLLHLSATYSSRFQWVMQFRIGTLRNVNSNMLKKTGPNTGFDCSASTGGTSGLAKFLDALNTADTLPKTILFSIDQNDNIALSTLSACFSQEGIKSKVQHGSAWWFNDTLSGMEQQLISFAEQGVLGNFVGMLTDSRSFLSYTRHEYFRRILCNLIGGWAECGKYPDNREAVGSLVQDICYNNVKEYFGF